MTVKKLRKVLFICPYFPPAHISSAHRQRHFALNLPSLGWKPVVLTAQVKRYERDLEWDLYNQLPPEVEIHHVLTIPEFPVRIGDLSVRVLPGMILKAIRLCRKGDIEVVYCTGGPWFAFILGPLLLKLFNIPYLLDYQDPWVYKPKGWKIPGLFSRAYLMLKISEWLEPRVLRNATKIIAVSPGTHEILHSHYHWLQAEKFITLPIGVELTDFDLANKKESENDFTVNTSMQITYTGAVWYGAWPVFKTFIDSVVLLLEKYPEIETKIHFNFIGTGLHKDKSKNNWVSNYAKDNKIDHIINEKCKSQFYLEAIRYMLNADMLLLFGSPERYYMASKLFLYLNANKPVFAILYDQSPMRPVLESCKNVWLVLYSDNEPIETKLETIFDAFYDCLRSSKLSHDVNENSEIIEKYRASTICEQFVKTLDEIVIRETTSAAL